MPDKKRILHSIASLAKQLGHTPSILEFAAHAQISRYSLFRLFPRWNEAVRAAGLKPNRLHSRPEDHDLLKDWGEVVRKKHALPSPWTYRLAGKYYSLTLAKRFGGWDSVPRAFRKFAKGKREWRDVLALLPASVPNEYPGQPRKYLRSASLPNKNRSLRLRANPQGYCPDARLAPEKPQHASFKGRATYGNPSHFSGFLREPMNEQGVVLLFGMLANELGYSIEAVQTGFPDCEAMRQIAPGRWQRVRIEFEFESKNFHDHGHSVHGCDVIVCWRHNWDQCPKHIEIVELSSVIKSLPNSPLDLGFAERRL
jgi:hypothetical protein